MTSIFHIFLADVGMEGENRKRKLGREKRACNHFRVNLKRVTVPQQTCICFKCGSATD